jgi:4a-hydroxytetrahydrobiopterin dehydratase
MVQSVYLNNNMSLRDKHCVPCEGKTKPLASDVVQQLAAEVPDWRVLEYVKIEKTWKFKDFVEAIIFVNEVAHLAEDEGHHPNIHVTNYNTVTIDLYTHAIKGLSENDFIMASKIDAIDIRHLI